MLSFPWSHQNSFIVFLKKKKKFFLNVKTTMMADERGKQQRFLSKCSTVMVSVAVNLLFSANLLDRNIVVQII